MWHCVEQHHVTGMRRRVWQYAAKAVLTDVVLDGWPGSLRNRDRLAQRRQYISLYQRKLQLARQQKASGQQLDPDEKVGSPNLTFCVESL
jgi:type II secretory pathway pseudopilin PulG